MGDSSSESVPEAAIEGGREGKRGESVESSMTNLERAWFQIELGLHSGWTMTGSKAQASGLTSVCLGFILQYMKREIRAILQGHVRIKWDEVCKAAGTERC